MAFQSIFFNQTLTKPNVSLHFVPRNLLCSAPSGDLGGHNAYEVLGLAETSSFAEIKGAFRRLAKENHPDLVESGGASASRRFLVILAAYEILSDSERRAHYDSYLLSQRRVNQNDSKQKKPIYTYRNHSSVYLLKEIETVEWLELYRHVIDDILTKKKIAQNSGFLGEIENELYSAICAAYYGPLLESVEYLPDSFEAEERSAYETSEVLHLVSGRDLFGSVSLANGVPQLSSNQNVRLTHSSSMTSEVCQDAKSTYRVGCVGSSEDGEMPRLQVDQHSDCIFDAYNDLELHISGKLVATATRISPSNYDSDSSADPQDLIHVFLKLNEDFHMDKGIGRDLSFPVRSVIPLGTIKGLGTSPEEGTCFVYDKHDQRTHVIVKHRTLLVKHLHWYQARDHDSTCECRCRRARLPPSKFWLFAPRCGMHDVGGWYIETFGRDKNCKNILSQRHWDGVVEHEERRLHPAMYLMALAYRTLDLEVVKRRKRTISDVIIPKVSGFLYWCKRFL